MTRPGLRRLVSVAAGPLVLFGCATHAVEFPPQTPRGHIAARPGRPGLVVAAPHGSSDVQTGEIAAEVARDRKSTRLNSSHGYISYAVFCLKKKKTKAE